MNDNQELLRYRQLSNSRLIDSCKKLVLKLSKTLDELDAEVRSKKFRLGSELFSVKFQKASEISSSVSLCTKLLVERKRKKELSDSEIKSVDFLKEHSKSKSLILKINSIIAAKIDNASALSKIVVEQMVLEAQQNSCYNSDGCYIDQSKIELRYPKSLVNVKNNCKMNKDKYLKKYFSN